MTDRFVVNKDMAYNRRDMIAGLRRAFGDALDIDGDIVRVNIGAGALNVELGAEAERRIALIRIVHVPVTLTFIGLDETGRTDALQRFDRAFQRGGG